MKEYDIRPAHIFEEYLKLSAQDADICFRSTDKTNISCPACGADHSSYEFEKNGFAYSTCQECGTLYQTPRPSKQAFEKFYHQSKSSQYWAEVFFPSVAEKRRDKIFVPRVERLISLCEQRNLNPETVMDVGAGYGIFLDEWRKHKPTDRLIAVEPSLQLSEICRQKDIEVIPSIVEKVIHLDGMVDLAVCFEVLEHVYDALEFILQIKRMLKSGGDLLISTLGVDGFDIQVLWDKSKSVSPPHHINFLSIKGFQLLFERAGFKDIQILTPGVLDVDIVKNSLRDESDLLRSNRFLNSILSDEKIANSFQNFLVENKMSSHVWVLARK
ncbi:MAG: class I SAM-dependent methyltransferase [Gammaproteobacteria bacterium]|nr:class I SAM-dependent methyltransferase [Gammaproteobacteria bacterium]